MTMTMSLTKTVHDPDAFAKDLFSALSADCAADSPLSMGAYAGAELATFERFEQAAIKAAKGTDAAPAVASIGDTVVGLALACYSAGIRFGIAAETLRRQLLANGKES